MEKELKELGQWLVDSHLRIKQFEISENDKFSKSKQTGHHLQ
jgi:hypothetical protein